MITLKDWMEAVNYRITEGSEYCWHCYGPAAYTLDSWDGDHDGVSASVVFSTNTQNVFELTVADYRRQRAYRYINPQYLEAYRKEAEVRGDGADQAWDDVRYIDLETEADFLEKLHAIMNYLPYDERVEVPLTLPQAELFQLMKLAHQQDLTLNELIEDMLREMIDQYTPED